MSINLNPLKYLKVFVQENLLLLHYSKYTINPEKCLQGKAKLHDKIWPVRSHIFGFNWPFTSVWGWINLSLW